MDATSTDGRDELTYGRFRAVLANRDARVYYGLDFDEKRVTSLRQDDEESREFFTNWTEEGRPPYSKRPLLYNRPAFWPGLLGATLLLIAVLPLPYFYFEFLRVVECAVAICMGFLTARARRLWWLPGFLAIVILWLPAGYVVLTPSVWRVLDVVAAAYVMAVACMTFDARPSFPDNDYGQANARISVPWAWWKVAVLAAAVTAGAVWYGTVSAGDPCPGTIGTVSFGDCDS